MPGEINYAEVRSWLLKFKLWLQPLKFNWAFNGDYTGTWTAYKQLGELTYIIERGNFDFRQIT